MNSMTWCLGARKQASLSLLCVVTEAESYPGRNALGFRLYAEPGGSGLELGGMHTQGLRVMPGTCTWSSDTSPEET